MTPRLSYLLALCALALLALPASALAFGPLASFGSFGEGAGQLKFPLGVALAPDGNVYVGDEGNHRIDVFSPTGAFLFAFGKEVNAADHSNICTAASGCKAGVAEAGAGAFVHPVGIAVGREGNLFVADEETNRINVFTATGSFLRAFGAQVNADPATMASNPNVCTIACKQGLQSVAAGGFNSPDGLGFDGAGNLFVADAQNNRINVFGPDGSFIRAFGKRVNPSDNSDTCTAISGCRVGVAGAGPGEMIDPNDVKVAPGGQALVSDANNRRIDVFGVDGGFIRAFGKEVNPALNTGASRDVCASQCQAGSSAPVAGALFSPTELAIDANGRLYVADFRLNRIDLFNLNGSFIRAFGAGVADGAEAFQICEASCQAGLETQLPGDLSDAFGVALDCRGALFATSAEGFNGKGKVVGPVQRFGEPGTPLGPCPVPASTSPPPRPKPSNKFKLAKLALNKHKGTATLAVIVPGPGTLALKGKGLKATTRTAKAAGTLKLAIQPLAKAKRALAIHHKLSLKAQVTFTPSGGKAATQVKALQLKQMVR